MTTTNYPHSIRARLLNMSKGNNSRYQQLIVRYFHERLLYRLSKSDYRDRFILKGGALLYAFDEFIPRPTLDIDFMGNRIDNDKSNLLKVFRAIAKIENKEDGVQFLDDTLSAEDIIVEKEYPGVRISMIGMLGTFRQKLTFDVGFGDIIVPSPIDLDYPTIFDTMTRPNIIAYSLETVVAEKFQTIIDRGRFNSRMKDYFDLYRILSVHTFVPHNLAEAIKATFDNRGTVYHESHEFFTGEYGNDDNLNRQWNNYVSKLKIDLPDFNGILNFIRPVLKPYWERLKD